MEVRSEQYKLAVTSKQRNEYCCVDIIPPTLLYCIIWWKNNSFLLVADMVYFFNKESFIGNAALNSLPTCEL